MHYKHNFIFVFEQKVWEKTWSGPPLPQSVKFFILFFDGFPNFCFTVVSVVIARCCLSVKIEF